MSWTPLANNGDLLHQLQNHPRPSDLPPFADVSESEAQPLTGAIKEIVKQLHDVELPLVRQAWASNPKDMLARDQYTGIDFAAWFRTIESNRTLGRILGGIAAPMEGTLLRAIPYSDDRDSLHGTVINRTSGAASFEIQAPTESSLAQDADYDGVYRLSAHSMARAIGSYADLDEAHALLAWDSFCCTCEQTPNALVQLVCEVAGDEVRIRLDPDLS